MSACAPLTSQPDRRLSASPSHSTVCPSGLSATVGGGTQSRSLNEHRLGASRLATHRKDPPRPCSRPSVQLDSRARVLQCEYVLRLLLAIVIALSLLGSPGAARSAPSVSCSMPGADHGQAADHEKMRCCTPDCATPAPSAMLPNGSLGAASLEPAKIAVWIPSYLELVAVNPAAADPPPRAFSV